MALPESLMALARDAQRLAAAGSVPNPAEADAQRVLRICNACRYCEGYCAMFPALARRLEFAGADVHYLANLCHHCGACLHSCQYAPPHEFGVNVPRSLARVRHRTYSDYAWPRTFAATYRRNGLTVALALAAGLVLFAVLALVRRGTLWHVPLDGDFYAVFPHGFLVSLFGAAFGLAVLALGVGVANFWRSIAPREAAPQGNARAAVDAARDALRLRYLDGGHGEGCNNEDDAWTPWRRRLHHVTFYGFALCFASTCVATIYHYGLDWPAPYPVASAPVLLGTVGGLGLLIGPAGLLWLNLRRHPLHGDPDQHGMDRGFIALLLLTSASGLALLTWRDTGAMAMLLAVHLGVVLALFVTLPYGKFAHGVYRCAALLKWEIEKRLPVRVGLVGD